MSALVPTPPARSAPVVWAAFLACSWTWCIGMFLPIVLWRDYGLWGFLAFAAPNVVGAASVGWVLRKPIDAQALLHRHRLAIGLFSAVTIAFHVYWLAWIGSWTPTVLGLHRHVVAGVLASAILALIAFTTGSHSRLVAAATPLWLGSALILAVIVASGATAAAPMPASDAHEVGLLWLAPVMLFGFALCPYLDGTFLTARAALTESAARWAFGLGFGVLFLGMIVGTALYAPLLSQPGGGPAAAQWVGAVLLVHLLVQSAFSVAVHSRLTPWRSVHPALIVALLLAAAVGAVAASRLSSYAGLSAGEIGYRLFLAFYGLVFPAYVWLVMIPPRSPVDRRRQTRVFAAAVGVAAPMFWMGFIEREEFWLVPGLLAVLLARLLVRGARVPSAEPAV